MSRRTGAFELICGYCGDHPYLEYSDLPSRLQQVRGPYTREAGLAAYAEHLGLVPRLHEPGPAGAALGAAMISSGDPDIATGTQPAACLAVRIPLTRHGPRDPWLRIAAEGAMTLPLAGQPADHRARSQAPQGRLRRRSRGRAHAQSLTRQAARDTTGTCRETDRPGSTRAHETLQPTQTAGHSQLDVGPPLQG
jgi:hypothetical protein